MLKSAKMTKSRAPRLVLTTLALCLVALAAHAPAASQAQACTDCDGGMDAAVPEDAAVSAPTALDASVDAGVSVDGGSSDAAVTTTVVTAGLDGSLGTSLDGGKGTNQSGVTWVHEGCSLTNAAPGRTNVAACAGLLAAMTLLLRRRRARRAL